MSRFLITSSLACLLVPAALAQDWQAPKMPWGDPDFQGTWTTATLTTLARPEQLEKLVLTE